MSSPDPTDSTVLGRAIAALAGEEPERAAEAESRGLHLSLAGRITVGFLLLLVLVAAMAVAATYIPLEPWLNFLIILFVGIPLGTWVISRTLRPVSQLLESLTDGIRSFRDRDFSVRLASGRQDELGEMARLYNRVGEILLEERKDLRQKELLLQTALNRSPVAIILVNALRRVIYSNREARSLLLGGAKLEGQHLEELIAGCPPQMREILSSETDGIFSVQSDEQTETYHLSQRDFQLNRRPHTLIILRRMTGELGRQEAEIWKRVIRVISHELNNSLAPVSSLVHSAKVISQDPEQAERLDEVFNTIQERIRHLTRFIEGYAKFARLPQPRKREVHWEELINALSDLATVRIIGRLPADPAFLDPAQMQQVLLNLVKNAVEASNGDPDIAMRIKSDGGGGTFLQVMDHGRGMDEETMRKALLPFYSTKKTGTGLGLPLCREILEAHGGKISLQAQGDGGTVVTCWLPPR
ncbi:MAG: ATP-binding protein [Thermoanaerobaculia bacterium]